MKGLLATALPWREGSFCFVLFADADDDAEADGT